jgi:hypothetical protein
MANKQNGIRFYLIQFRLNVEGKFDSSTISPTPTIFGTTHASVTI